MHKFAHNDALPGMRTPIEQVASSIIMYYEGMSLKAIGRHLDQMNNNNPSKSTIFEWVARFTKEALERTKVDKPQVGNVWVAGETVLKIGGDKLWLWDVIDTETRFLLAFHISRTRTAGDARKLMLKAAERAGRVPRVVITDRLHAYLDGIELAFGANTKHYRVSPFDIIDNINLIERFHGTLKARTKVMRGIKKEDKAKLFAQGWLLYYNYVRPHESLGKTPAEAAGLKEAPFRNWINIVKQRVMWIAH